MNGPKPLSTGGVPGDTRFDHGKRALLFAEVGMKEWWAASEIAAAKLPGLPTVKGNVTHFARRHAWISRPRAGRGGGREYHVSNFLAEAQALAGPETAGSAQVATPKPVTGTATGRHRDYPCGLYERAPEKKKREAQRRLEIVRKVDAMVGAGLTRQAAMAAAAKDDSAPTVRRWISACRSLDPADWLAALVPNHQGRPRPPGYDRRIYLWFKRESHPPATVAYERTARLAKAADLSMPRIAALSRRLKRELPRP